MSRHVKVKRRGKYMGGPSPMKIFNFFLSKWNIWIEMTSSMFLFCTSVSDIAFEITTSCFTRKDFFPFLVTCKNEYELPKTLIKLYIG